MKNLRKLAIALLAAGWLAGANAQALRPEVGKPLQQASELLKAGKAKEALAKVREAERVPGQTPAEQLTVARMLAATAQRAGDNAAALQALEAIAGKVSGAELADTDLQIASAYAQSRNNAKAQEWLNRAIQAGASGPNVKQLQSYLQSAGGDYSAIARDAGAAVAAAEQAGRRPEEADLLRLADAQQRTGNQAGYFNSLEKLLYNYPKKDYWAAFLGRLPRRSGFSDRFALDVMRLRLATGNLTQTDDFMEMAQLALQAALPVEAARVLDQGYKSGALGSGPGAAREQRLRDLTTKKVAEQKASIAGQTADAARQPTGDDLVRAGIEWASMGDADKGIELIKQGIAKGGLKYPEDARLRLGMAQLQSGKGRGAATATLRGVKGNDGVADIAHLWLIAPAS